jgi:hypothetical protein
VACSASVIVFRRAEAGREGSNGGASGTLSKVQRVAASLAVETRRAGDGGVDARGDRCPCAGAAADWRPPPRRAAGGDPAPLFDASTGRPGHDLAGGGVLVPSAGHRCRGVCGGPPDGSTGSGGASSLPARARVCAAAASRRCCPRLLRARRFAAVPISGLPKVAGCVLGGPPPCRRRARRPRSSRTCNKLLDPSAGFFPIDIVQKEKGRGAPVLLTGQGRVSRTDRKRTGSQCAAPSRGRRELVASSRQARPSLHQVTSFMTG